MTDRRRKDQTGGVETDDPRWRDWPANVDPERSIIPTEDYARIIALGRADREPILPPGAKNHFDGTVAPGEAEF